MGADKRYFGQRTREEKVAVESPSDPMLRCAHLVMRYEQHGNAAEAMAEAAAESADYGGKFGVEEHALYDFRDYGLD